MKRYPKANQNNPGVEEAIENFGKAQRKFNKSEKLSRKEIRKLEPGQSYITRKGKLAWKRTRKEEIETWFWMILSWILFPFIWVGKKIRAFIYEIFWPKSNFRWNGIIGPGGHTSYERHFSWGKLSFVLVIAFIIVYFIFLR